MLTCMRAYVGSSISVELGISAAELWNAGLVVMNEELILYILGAAVSIRLRARNRFRLVF